MSIVTYRWRSSCTICKLFSIFYFKILIFWQQFPLIWLNMNLDINFMMDFSWCFYLGPILRYLATKNPYQNAWTKCVNFFSIFYFKIPIFWQQFPFIWLNMHLVTCFNLMIDFSWCVYLGPILRYLATKISRKFPIKMHGRNLWLYFFSLSLFEVDQL